MLHTGHCFGAGDLEYLPIADNIRDSERRQSGLPGPEKLAWTTQFHVHFRYVESVCGFHQGTDSFARSFSELTRDKYAVALFGATSDSSAKLMQLCKPEPFG